MYSALPLTIELEYAHRVTFAMDQAGIALVRRVALTNVGEAPISQLNIELSLDNQECDALTSRLERLMPGHTFGFEPARFKLSPSRLAARTEAERTMLRVSVTAPEGCVAQEFPVDLLAFDQWPGVGLYPELLAAFVTPNHAHVAELLRAARSSLEAVSGRDAFDGYQSGSRRRASHIAEACFSAAQALGLGYINAPASFELDGQRVRLIDRVRRESMGCCLDLSVLLASLWEQAGLHPLIIVLQGHALPALWTSPTQLPEPAIDDAARVRNLVKLGEIVPVESTFLTHPSASFASSVAEATRRLESPGEIFCAIDVRCARLRGVRPLPLRDSILPPQGDEPGVGAVATTTAALNLVALADRVEAGDAGGGSDAPKEAPGDRVRRWQSRLLDLSLRNRLINFRETGRTLGLEVPDLSALENGLAAEARYSIFPRTEGDEAYRREQLGGGAIYSAATEALTQSTLLALYRARKSLIDEIGANPLYFALGMLRWFESDSSEHARRAPILLLPAELTRHTAASGYRYEIGLGDDPIRPNVTLLEKLRVEFGLDTSSLAELPEDENGIDVPWVFRNFRAAIREQRRWEVEETAFLGLFSFNKFLMWRDLQEHLATLRQSRLVAHLLERPGHDLPGPELPRPERLDDEVPPDELLCTRDADSSQLAAVRAAASDMTFVLEGPPGTGKSQTIANIVADSIAHGKRVLFVAEKMAALGVVRDRLEKDGLGAFCLELHSAKSSKKEVLAQLERAVAGIDAAAPAEWPALCGALAKERAALNEYARELHRERASGETLYGVMGRLSVLGAGPAIAPVTQRVEAAGADQLATWRADVQAIVRGAGAVDPVHGHALRGVGRTAWSFTLPDAARAALGECMTAVTALRRAVAAFAESLGAVDPTVELSGDAVAGVIQLAELLPQSPAAPSELLVGRDAAGWASMLRELIEAGRRRDAERARILSAYRRELLQADLPALIDPVDRALARRGLLGMWARYSIRRRLRRHCLGVVPELQQVRRDLDGVREITELTARLNSAADAARILGPRWRGGEADWAALAALVEWSDRFRAASGAVAATRGGATLVGSLAEAAAQAPPPGASVAKAAELGVVAKAWRERRDALAALLVTTEADFAGESGARGWFDSVAATLKRWQSGLGALNDWCAWREARDQAVAAGLAPIVTAVERGELSREAVADALERGFGLAWFNAIADSIPVIRDFNAQVHGARIERFGQLDRSVIAATHRMICARLGSVRPDVAVASSPQSEIGILRRELQKKARHLPTRRLVEAIPNLLARIKPCFLMSPLSVAQYLDAKLPPFDVVIFDEASQIPVWDSIGAIARGKSVIVVGDSRQLPPTSFFNTLDGEEDVDVDLAQVDDMESILQECTASGVSSMWLSWHYRSRHESLIAFSNHFYYRDRLHTFPSPIDRSPDLGVTLRHVAGGVYDRGGSRTNRVEAELVVDEVVRMLTSTDAPDSIGVVTFNMAQQSLIEDLLDARRRAEPRIERFFTGEVGEPVFVKNLESVQGDERDTIIFSVGYGPDQAGRISMNFGPLNADGGERRLNVAVTRSRRRLIVFSSLRSDQIDLRRTQAVGVAHFKTFLDYADRGPRAIAEALSVSGERDVASGFEQAVWHELTARGWTVDTQVGCAGYRVDLAVRDPQRPGRYFLGIECDGATYHSAKTARDRDRLRESVLRGLGWTIARVWSTDWRIDRDRCIAKLEAAIRAARDAALDPGAPSPTQTSAVAPELPPPVAPGAPTVPPPAANPAASGLPEYRVATCPNHRLQSRDIHDPDAADPLLAALSHMVASEAPIVEELAIRRLADWLDVQRVTDRFRQRFAELRDFGQRSGAFQFDGFAFWSAGARSDAFDLVRVPGDAPESARDVELIPTIELINGVVHVVTQQIGLPREELEREVGRLFGVRLTARSRAVLADAVARAIELGRVVERGGRVTAGG